MRKKVRKSLAFLLALALVVSVMSGLGLSVSADEAQNEPVAAAAEGEQTTPVEETPKAEEKEEKTAEPAAEPEKKDEEKAEGEGSGAKTAEKQDETTPKAGENVQTATIGTGDKTVTVKTTAAAGVLPEGAKLVVKKLANQDQAYQDAESTLKDSQVTYDDFLALDVGFEVNGKEVEPEAGSVQVQFELGAGLLPETADTSTLAVQHLTDGKAETVADAGAVTTGDVTVKNEVVKADFEVKSFSTFTITWGEYWTITAHYVDESDKEINPSTVDQEISFYYNDYWESDDEKNITFETDSNYALVFAGYKYKEAYIKVNGEKKRVTGMTIKLSSYPYSNKARTVTFYDGDTPVKTQTYSGSKITDDLYLVYAADATIGGSGGSITDQKKLSHDKYVEAKTDGTYDLSLTVSGAKGSKTDKAKLDILLIVDKSRSMRFPMNRDLDNYEDYPKPEDQRITKVANAANSLITALDAKKDILDVNYSVVTFNGPTSSGSGKESDASVSLKWSESSTGVASAITTPSPDGATNYQAAIRKAKTQLNQARPDAQKVVIFLTDGEPTVRIGGGTGLNDNNSYNINAAIGEISNMWTDYFYCVGAGPAFQSSSGTTANAYKNLDNLKNSVHATNKDIYKAISTEELNKIFTDMSANITNLYCDHVTVTDELSDNVQLVKSVSGTPKNLTVTVKKGDKDGVEVVSAEKQVIFQKAEIWAEYKDGKIWLHFPANYTLDPEYTYIVTANIEATETAYQRVRENGGNYLNVGEKGTGKTSEGEWGVFTNTKAEVAYTYNDVPTTEGYNNPVIQLEPAHLTINKTITGLTEEKINSELNDKLTFNITYTYPTGKQETVTETKKLSDFTKTADGTYTYTYTSGDIWSMGATYKVTETGYNTVTDYDCAATSTDASGSIPKYSTATASFTNAYTLSTQDLTITKEIWVDGNKYDGVEFNGAEYTFTVSGNKIKDKTVTVNGAGSATIKGLPVGSYTITETNRTKEPAKYEFEKNNNPQTIALSKENNTVTIKNEYKTKKYKVYVRKELDGNMYDSSDRFDFTVTGKDGTLRLGKDETSSAYEVTYGDSFTVKETNDKGYTSTTAKAYKAIVGNGTVSTGEAINGTYTDADKSYTLNNITEDIIIVYTNKKQINPPNGIITTIAPYAIMVVLAAGAGVYFVYSRRRRNR